MLRLVHSEHEFLIVQEAFSSTTLTFFLVEPHLLLQGSIKLLDEERFTASWVTPEVDTLDIVKLFILLLEQLERLAFCILRGKLLIVILVSFELILITEKCVNVIIKPLYYDLLI